MFEGLPGPIPNPARLFVALGHAKHLGTGNLRLGHVGVESTSIMTVFGPDLPVEFAELFSDPREGKQEVQTPARGVLQVAWIPQRWVGRLDRLHIQVDLGEVVEFAVATVDLTRGQSLDDDLQDLLEALPGLGIGVTEEKMFCEADAPADADVEPPAAQVVQHADIFDES